MKKTFLLLFTFVNLLGFTLITDAEPTISATLETPTSWLSKNSSDKITINNGNGNDLTITINVNKPPIVNTGNTANNQGNLARGINITNCGETKHIEVGSSAVCSTRDPSNPVSFSSDSQNPLMGSYVIKQNK